jgi:hypothetical protein
VREGFYLLVISSGLKDISEVGLFLEIFARTEKDTSGRPVLNLLAFNDFIQFLETIQAAFEKFAINGSIQLYVEEYTCPVGESSTLPSSS